MPVKERRSDAPIFIAKESARLRLRWARAEETISTARCKWALKWVLPPAGEMEQERRRGRQGCHPGG